MGIQFGDEKQVSSLITRVTVINPNPSPVEILPKYYCLFHGKDLVEYGRHVIRFPVSNMGYKRLVSSFQADYAGQIRVDFGAVGIDEI